MDKKRQVIAVLSSLSNINMGIAADTEQELVQNAQSKISAALKDDTIAAFIGDWELAWGPFIFATQNKPTAKYNPNKWVTHNTMYVAKGVVPDTAIPLYVVAIAGTNLISEFGWVVEDGDVIAMNKWDENDTTKGNISKGSHIGLEKLLAFKDENGKNVIDFFTRLEIGNAEIATCGHSLGGALSPLMALKLIEAKAASTISTYPSAGATSGDKAFAQYAGQLLANNYFSTINDFDIVPHAWTCRKSLVDKTWFTLNHLPKLYDTPYFNGGNGIPMPSKFPFIVDGLIASITIKNYTRILPDTEFRFRGVAQEYDEREDAGYFKEAGYQHTTVYNASNAFDLPDNVVAQIHTYFFQK